MEEPKKMTVVKIFDREMVRMARFVCVAEKIMHIIQKIKTVSRPFESSIGVLIRKQKRRSLLIPKRNKFFSSLAPDTDFAVLKVSGR